MNCPNCRTSNPENAKFCMDCGASLSTGKRDEKSKSGFLDQYLPQELAAKLEAARARQAMVGERRVITMLFCDVKGSTSAAEKVDPEVWTEVMNGVFERMIRPIYKYEGIVPRLMGDAILAFFGAPIAHEDDPRRAVLAGLEIQAEIQPYIREMQSEHGIEFGLRVGINTGLVVVGEIGSDLRMEYTAIGDAINLAARMEQTAAPGTVQISEETHKLVAPFFEIEELGEIEVKGKSAPVRAYRVLAARETPGQVRGLGGLSLSSPLVGREAQLALLHERLEKAAAGRGSFLAVIGEAGLGKSSLISDIQRSSDPARLQWLRGEALSYARSISYFPWRQIIRQSIDARQDDTPEVVRGKLNHTCECCAMPGGDIPFLEAMLAVESEASSQVVMGFQGEALVERMTEATRGYLCGLAQEKPMTLVFDDLHWADEASLNLLYGLCDLAGPNPILFICMLRPDHESPGWNSIHKIADKIGESYRAILLEPLPAGDMDTLLENLLGMQGLPKTIRDLIVEKAGGNPFFVEELIRSLVETKQIVRADGSWRAAVADAKLSLPDTLRGVLGARIDRLPETARDVLQNAAVIGRSFDLRVLGRLTHLNGGLDPQIRYLKDASLIEPLHDEYAFRHVLIQEAAYESILLKKRAALHRQIGETLEELHADRIEEFAPLLANHFHAAHDPRSLKYDLLAGEKAARLYANAEAAVHFSRALEIARRDHRDQEQITSLFIQLGHVLELAGRYEQALENYEAMQAFGREQDVRSIEFAALMAKSTIYSTYTSLHDPALGEQTLLQALELSGEIGDRAAQARLNWNLMLTYLFSKRLDQSLKHGQVALALARQSDDREQLAFVLNDLCRLYTCMGEFEKAYAVIHEARALWQAVGNQAMLADSYGSEAEALFQAGEHPRALELLNQGLELNEKIENLWGQAYDRMLISFIQFDKGEIGRGIELSHRSITEGDQAGLIASSTSHRAELGWFYGYYGAPEKGFELVDRALEIADAKQPAFKALPLAVKVRLHLMQGSLPAAQATAGPRPLEPITIPYARYTMIVCLANVELALAQKDHARALALAEELLTVVAPLTRVDVPGVIHRKADALIGLGRLDEAHQALTEACALCEGIGSTHHLWSILMTLADLEDRLGRHDQAGLHRSKARPIVEAIARGLEEIGLREAFLGLARVRDLMHKTG